jgi:putative DNA primase/helicase
MSAASQLAEALGARANGSGWTARCPAHEDSNPSLSISEGEGDKVLVKCHAGCSQEAVIAALRELGLWAGVNSTTGLTVAALAAAKGLPEALLRESGFSDDNNINGHAVIRMEYRDEFGEIVCTRYRGSVEKGPARFWFRKGDKQQLFGRWRLRGGEPVIVVEGETDTVALWAGGFNAIGVPGAEAWNDKRFAPQMEDCPLLYVHVEPDEGGDKFMAAFRRSTLRPRVRFFTVPKPAKDPCELRARAGDGAFKGIIDQLLRDADEPAAEPEEDQAQLPPGVSDDELALRFTERHGEKLCYVPAWDRWLIWDGKRWAHDEKKRVFDLARALCRDVLTEQLAGDKLTQPQTKALRHRLGSAVTVYALVRLAGSDPRHAVAVKQLDADPWVLNTPGGILDLRTGELAAHDPAALHTKITAAIPGGECPLFRSTLERVQPDPTVRDYLQRLAGYGMTGSSRDHVLAFWHGHGRNGKGTIVHAIRRAFGDYGLEIPAETLMESHHERHLTEIAVLHGARLVVGSEIDSGRRWNESRLKRLTGGDPISARYIGKDLFEFEPTHTLVIVGNAKPGLRSVDEAIRARMHLVEFTVTIPVAERDTTLPERLASEYGGILAWALEGCLDWQADGLAPPKAVQTATAAYLLGEDMLQAWADECCERGGQLTLAAAHRSYRQWCERNGAIVLGRNTFADHLEARGFKKAVDSHSKGAVFTGISLPVREDPRCPE